MEKKDFEYFKELLTKRLEGLLDSAYGTVSGMTALKENIPGQTDNPKLFNFSAPGLDVFKSQPRWV